MKRTLLATAMAVTGLLATSVYAQSTSGTGTGTGTDTSMQQGTTGSTGATGGTTGTAGAAAGSADADYADEEETSGAGGTAATEAGASAGDTVRVSELDSQAVRQIQEALNEAGHDVGEVDGVWGQRTAEALRKFQEEQNLEASGELDQETIAALELDPSALQGSGTASTGGDVEANAETDSDPQVGLGSADQTRIENDRAMGESSDESPDRMKDEHSTSHGSEGNQ